MVGKILFLLNNTIERVLYAALSLMVDIFSLTLIVMFDVQLVDKYFGGYTKNKIHSKSEVKSRHNNDIISKSKRICFSGSNQYKTYECKIDVYFLCKLAFGTNDRALGPY